MKRLLQKLTALCAVCLVTLSAAAQDYLCFTANTASSTVALNQNGTPTAVSIEYSTDGTNWNDYTIGAFITLAKAGDKVYFRNASDEVTGFSTSSSDYYQFVMTGSIAASGSVMSLVDQSSTAKTIPGDYCFCNMFSGCSTLTTAPDLPATTLANYCCESMFRGCSALATAPELPATTLASYCYRYMFAGCSTLTTAPALPATTLANYCYSYMFSNCSVLTTAPELPATTLANYCYQNMFSNCSVLTTAPELPATTLESYCYDNMFYNCKALATAPALPATTLASYCYRYMFAGCSTLTTAPELPATTLKNYCYQYMFASCSALKTAPELPATTLPSGCYSNMFKSCSNLNDIKVAFKDFLPTTSETTRNWVQTVSSTGTFSWPGSSKSSGSSKIPSGWTVKNTYDVTGTEIGWTSLYVNLPLTVPTGAEVYYASAVDGSTITLTQIEAGTTMAPRTAVIVKADESTTVKFAVAAKTGESYTNHFQGSSVAKAKTEDVYVLSGASENGNPQFQNYSGTTLNAHKIWLPKSALGGTTGSIQFRFDDATAITTIEMECSDDATYNLAGQRVSSDYRGLVIKNGKKMWNN